MRQVTLLAALLLAQSALGLTPNEWRFNQAIDVPSAGLTRVNLPPSTIDAARADLADVRVLDASGNEVPYLVDRPMPRRESELRAKELRTELQSTTTQITLDTGTKSPIKGVAFQAPAGAEFIKPVKVETSADGKDWREIISAQPIFRMNSGAENLRVLFPETPSDFLRLTIDDSRNPAVPFTGVSLILAEAKAPAEPVPVSIKSHDESPGVTRLALDLGAANLTLASVRIIASDPLFARAVTIATSALANDNIREQKVTSGSIYRLDLNGKTESRNELPVDSQVSGRELIVIVQNGDSPPLKVSAVEIDRRPARVVFLANAAGHYQLLVGNRQCTAPNYDLSAMSEQLKSASAIEAQPSALTTNPDFQAADTLANVPLEGAKIDLAGWKYRRRIQVTTAGAQQVELDPDVLAHSQPDLRDLRIITEDRQLPFLLECTSITRTISLQPAAANDPKKPTVSRLSLKLPQAGLPITQIVCAAGTALFQRDMLLSEEVSDERGDTYPRELGRASWKQVPDHPAQEFIIPVDAAPKSDTLFLETDNGDNPAIELHGFRATYPVTRAIFKTANDSKEAVWIYYGNPDAPAPRYDVNLIANQVLRAERSPASLEKPQSTGSTTARLAETLTGATKYIFWGVLGLVVVGLLLLISRLLPKAE